MARRARRRGRRGTSARPAPLAPSRAQARPPHPTAPRCMAIFFFFDVDGSGGGGLAARCAEKWDQVRTLSTARRAPSAAQPFEALHMSKRSAPRRAARVCCDAESDPLVHAILPARRRLQTPHDSWVPAVVPLCRGLSWSRRGVGKRIPKSEGEVVGKSGRVRAHGAPIWRKSETGFARTTESGSVAATSTCGNGSRPHPTPFLLFRLFRHSTETP